MKVKVIRSFAGLYLKDGREIPISAGMNEVIELPDGTDWLKAGLVEPYKEPAETAAYKPAETAAMPGSKPKPKRRARRKRTTAKKG